MFEPLESRRLQSGTVTLTTTGKEIVLSGDASANHVEVTQEDSPVGDGTPSGGFRVAITDSDTTFIVDGRTLNPRAQSYGLGPYDKTSPLATKPWHVELGGGADRIVFDRPAIRSLQLNLGRGNDVANVELNGTSVAVSGGDGDDHVLLGGLMGSASVYGGLGRDRIDVTGDPDPYFKAEARARFTGKLQIVDEHGPTIISMTYADVRRRAAIVTGNAVDRVSVSFCAFSQTDSLFTNGGDDILSSVNNTFRHGTYVRSGTGKNVLVGWTEDLHVY